MDNLLSVRLEAHRPDRNHHRFYELRIGRDFFGQWTLTICYGRIGQAGRERMFSSINPKALRKQIQHCLNVRETAPRRVGCRYRLVNIEQAEGVLVQDWLPEAWLQPFL